jgi:xylan 1,4-beta-xylosidase
MKLLQIVFLSIVFNTMVFAQDVRTINLDFNNIKGNYTDDTYFKCIGAGRANEGLRADWQQQLKVVKDECDFKYIRFHGIFHDDMGVYTEDREGNPIYNWQYVDKLYDYILSIEMKPFVELSFMPSALASGEQTIFWWKSNVTRPKDMKKYSDLILAFTQHLTDRYGKEEVSSWYFEVWNEPNHHAFFDGSMQDYFEMYKSAVLAIKSVSENHQVGGPSTAGATWDLIKQMLDFADGEKLPIDFISSHSYNVKGFLDEFGVKNHHLQSDSLLVAKQVNNVVEKLEIINKSEIELHITEWSSSYSSHDPVHDTYQNATFVLNTLKNTDTRVNSMSYWVFTDIFEEAGVPTKPFHGGFGLMNLQGIKKPTYFVYKYLNQLGSTELNNSDKYSWACKDNDNLQVLLYDFAYPKQGEVSNQIYFVQEHKPTYSKQVKINVDNITDGKYQLIVYKTGYLKNDVFTNYYLLGQPNQLSETQVEVLKSVASDAPISNSIIEVIDSKFSTDLLLNENDICLLKLNKL